VGVGARGNVRSLAAAAVVAVGVLVATVAGGPAPHADAAVGPSMSDTPDAGSVGTFVRLDFSAPGAQGCGGLYFEPAGGPGAGRAYVIGAAGIGASVSVVVPAVLETPSLHLVPVTPGPYIFTFTCGLIKAFAPFTVTSSSMAPSRFVGMAPTSAGQGYWLAQVGGGVFSYGDAAFHGSLPGRGIVPAAPIVGMAATPDGGGYWLAGADGGVFAFGDAVFYGSLPGRQITPAGPIVGITADPAGGGYWLLGADGGVFAFGAARYVGSVTQPGDGGDTFAPFVALSATSDGGGYFESSSNGVAFGFGDEHNADGDAVTIPTGPLGDAISGIALTTTDDAAWFVNVAGAVFSSNGAQPPLLGSLEGVSPTAPIVGMAATADGGGYWLVGADGGVFAFGNATFCGSAGDSGLPW
jgi:hypothetical protein